MNSLHPYFDVPLPTSAGGGRGRATVTPDAIRTAWRMQGGGQATFSKPLMLSASYLVVEYEWLYTALRKFHDLQLAIHGTPPQELYRKGAYVCVEYAYNFKAYLNDCHRLHWRPEIGPHKVAVGWACHGEARGNVRIPDDHATILMVTVHRGTPELWLWEPQLEGRPANYGKADCSQFYVAGFF